MNMTCHAIPLSSIRSALSNSISIIISLTHPLQDHVLADVRTLVIPYSPQDQAIFSSPAIPKRLINAINGSGEIIPLSLNGFHKAFVQLLDNSEDYTFLLGRQRDAIWKLFNYTYATLTGTKPTYDQPFYPIPSEKNGRGRDMFALSSRYYLGVFFYVYISGEKVGNLRIKEAIRNFYPKFDLSDSWVSSMKYSLLKFLFSNDKRRANDLFQKKKVKSGSKSKHGL